jgi:branched-chain amino acid aminotransferase
VQFYVDGEFVAAEDAKVHVSDRGFLYGDGCYESVGVWDGAVVQLDEHLARLGRSAAMLRISLPVTLDRLRELLLELAARNGMRDVAVGHLRPLVTRGNGPLGVKNVHPPGGSTLAIIADVLDAAGIDARREVPAKAIVSTLVRQAPATLDPRIKSMNYLTAVLAYLEAEERGADVAILRDSRGFVAEGHAMNLFCVRDGVLCTPPETAGLAGITRGAVLAVAREQEIRCVEAPLTVYDFARADEIFTTSAMRGLAPVGWLEGRELSTPAPGPVTRALITAHREYVRRTATPVPQVSAAATA